ncbi:MAG: 3-methyl-2-oxobutanoate hydroxymethyltransferase [Paracoccaceae bacterium]|nr:3-methyl-2-oxobutanoate hydroxymethyltransferase [Paracoccaceae bacterium]
MKNIYTWAARPAQRNWTIGDLLGLKGDRKWVQTTANTAEEAAAAETAGIDLIIGNAWNIEAVRSGSERLFLTAAIDLVRYPLPDDIMRAAMKALELGADAVMTPRSFDIVGMLAREDIPVMGHLGLVPRKSSWRGGLRAVGKTGEEAFDLYQDFRRLEDAGAVMVEAEVIPAPVMGEISRRCGLITVSLGSGPEGDVHYLFQNDICGEQPKSPRHSRAFGELWKLKQQMEEARIAALKAFREACDSGGFPGEAEVAGISPRELEDFRNRLA